MIRTFLFDRSTGELKTGNEELREAWQRDSNTLIWVDFGGEPVET